MNTHHEGTREEVKAARKVCIREGHRMTRLQRDGDIFLARCDGKHRETAVTSRLTFAEIVGR